jgi:hypothetical protein
MAFLHDLIFHLSPQQQLQLSELDLRPVEKNVIEFIMAQKKDSFPSALALKRLNLTQSHFEKTCSIILKKVIVFFSSDNPVDKIIFVKSIPGGKISLVRHVMKQCEKSIAEKDELIAFYQKCFDISSNLSVLELDEKEIKYYASKLLELRDFSKTPDELIKLKANALFAFINSLGASLGIESESKKKTIARKIEDLLNEATSLNHPRGLHYAYHVAGLFYMIRNDDKRALKIQEQNLNTLLKHASLFSEQELIKVRLRRAEVISLFRSEEEAFHEFDNILKNTTYFDSPTIPAMHARYFKIALKLEKYDTAKHILDNFFLHTVDKPVLSFKVMALLQYVFYFLHIGDTENASKYTDQTNRIIHKQKLLQYYIQLKMLETSLAYLKGDFHEAKIMCEKNLKFLRSKNFNASSSSFPLFYIAVKAIYELHFNGKKFNEKQQEAYDYYFEKSWSHMGGVLKRMLALRPASIS